MDFLSANGFAPANNELLSSYLCRVAQANGISSYRFCHREVPASNIWTRDVDRLVQSKAKAQYAQILSISGKQLDSLLLEPYERVINPDYQARSTRSFSKWINAIGIYHRTRTRFGLQFCPLCLSETSSFNRLWRLSFYTVCDQHMVELLDRCPSCSKPVTIHRCNHSICRCFHCGCYFDRCKKLQKMSADDTRLDFQRVCVESLGDGNLVFGALRAPLHEVLAFARTIETSIRSRERAMPRHPSVAAMRGEQLELCDRNDRQLRMDVFRQCLLNWPTGLLSLAHDLHFTQRTLGLVGEEPKWKQVLRKALPAGVFGKEGKQLRVRGVSWKLGENQYLRSPGWRERNAKMLVATVKPYGY